MQKIADESGIERKWFKDIFPVSGSDAFLLAELSRQAEEIVAGMFFVERHATRLGWFHERENRKKNLAAQVITFYSFKGGNGRTTSMVLTALELVQRGKRVVIVDFDLEAPGLATLLPPEDEEQGEYGVVDYLLESSVYAANEMDLDSYVYKLNDRKLIGHEAGELFVMPASQVATTNDQHYLEKISRIDFNHLAYRTDKTPIQRLLNQLDEQYKPDYIFIDSRTGFNDIGGLMLGRMSDTAVLLFNGNEQNLAGMRMVLPRVVKADIPFYLLHGPTPIDERERAEAEERFIETSYQILCDVGYYSETDGMPLPDIKDETAAHYPLTIQFNPAAMRITQASKLLYLLKDEPYRLLADYMAAKGTIVQPIDAQQEDVKRIALEQLSQMKSVAEQEFEDTQLSKKFYPLKEYKFIFNPSSFLILGSKGSGKTALFSVLKHPDYVKALAAYLKEETDFVNATNWLVGSSSPSEKQTIDARKRESKITFTQEQLAQIIRGMDDQSEEAIRLLWKLHLLRILSYNGFADLREIDELQPYIEGDVQVFISSSGTMYSPKFDALVDAQLNRIDEQLLEEKRFITVIYDGLDLIGREYRGALTSQLIFFWFRSLTKFSNLKAKIFLREDIYRNEIKFDDKVKVRNYSIHLEWSYDQLLAMLWKRMLESSPRLTELLVTHLKQTGNQLTIEAPGLGYVPLADSELNRQVLAQLVGERMSSGRSAFTYNWIANHLSDTNEKISPRSILALMIAATERELDGYVKKGDILPLIAPKSLIQSMNDVSKDKVEDIGEEYKEYGFVFDDLYSECKYFPAEESVLIEALTKIKPADYDSTAMEIITALEEIGVMKKYATRKIDEETRYHIPDIFLLGMHLHRKGPGARKL